jgi:hypothetical protein
LDYQGVGSEEWRLLGGMWRIIRVVALKNGVFWVGCGAVSFPFAGWKKSESQEQS